MFTMFTVEERKFGVDSGRYLTPLYPQVIYRPLALNSDLQTILAKNPDSNKIFVVYDIMQPNLLASQLPTKLAAEVMKRLRPFVMSYDSEHNSFFNVHRRIRNVLMNCNRDLIDSEEKIEYWYHDDRGSFYIDYPFRQMQIEVILIGGLAARSRSSNYYSPSGYIFDTAIDPFAKDCNLLHTYKDAIVLLANSNLIESLSLHLEMANDTPGDRGVIAKYGSVLPGFIADERKCQIVYY